MSQVGTIVFFQLPVSFTSTLVIENVSHGDVVMSRIHGIKGWTTEEALQGRCFLWETEVLM